MKKAMFLAVAGAILMAGGAYAQQRLIADVPFGFTTGNHELAAGNYELKMGDPLPRAHLQLINSATHKAIFIRAASPEYTYGEARPRLVFRCVDGRCALAQVWSASETGYRFALPKAREGANVRMATVYLHRATNAD